MQCEECVESRDIDNVAELEEDSIDDGYNKLIIFSDRGMFFLQGVRTLYDLIRSV